jgi:TetR/AcrR family transcriptional regulator
MRAEQREATREQIVIAALLAISESGFDGVSTRAIAERANVSQGLLTYHFKSKEALWRAAADHLFAMANDTMERALSPSPPVDPLKQRRNLIRQMVYFSAAHPEFLLFMLEHEKENSKRSRWLVDTHLRPMYQKFVDVMGDTAEVDLPHALYTVAGASGLIFCAHNECKQLTGVDPRSDEAIKRHAEYLASLIVPESNSIQPK